MIRLGHIDYINCIPLHAPFLEGDRPDTCVLRGVPTELNQALAEGTIDLAPCSSIEFARHADYSILRGLAIASDGPVGSILLESEVPLAELDGADVHVPTASATSVVLLRAILELRLGVRPRLRPYAQERTDPFSQRAVAALWIGDAAMRRTASPGRVLYDLGAQWADWVGLPFVYAVWQVGPRVRDHGGLAAVHATLLAQRDRLTGEWPALARRYASSLRMSERRLIDYWRALRFHLDDRASRGLLRFYELAAQLGEAPPVNALRWYDGVEPTAARDPSA